MKRASRAYCALCAKVQKCTFDKIEEDTLESVKTLAAQFIFIEPFRCFAVSFAYFIEIGHHSHTIHGREEKKNQCTQMLVARKPCHGTVAAATVTAAAIDDAHSFAQKPTTRQLVLRCAQCTCTHTHTIANGKIE